MKVRVCLYVFQSAILSTKHWRTWINILKRRLQGLISEHVSHLEPSHRGWKHEMMLNPTLSPIRPPPPTLQDPRATIRGRSLILSLVAKQLFVQKLPNGSVSMTLFYAPDRYGDDLNGKDQTCLTGQTGERLQPDAAPSTPPLLSQDLPHILIPPFIITV